MRILVDADACPVKQIIVKTAKEYKIKVIMLIDTSHLLDDGYSEVIMVDKGADSVDLALVNRLTEGDLVVTQDYGLAAMALAKAAKVINQDGMEYDQSNIERLLFQRFVSKKIRKSGGRTTNPKKRRYEDDIQFERTLRRIIENLIGA